MSNPSGMQAALITGAGRGIGRAIARAYARAGIAVVCAARSREAVDRVADTIRAEGGQALAVACDVTDSTQLDTLCRRAYESWRRLDILVVNAGMDIERKPVADSGLETWRAVVELNLVAAMAQCRAAIPYLRRNGGGKILFMGSGIGRLAVPGTSAYACSKAGLAVLCRVLARELRDDAIAVNEIIPGPVRTRMTGIDEERAGRDEESPNFRGMSGEWIKNPSDVAPLALFLAGLPNDGPSGQSFSLNGRDLGRI